MRRRVCPACARRSAELIDPTCPVCYGEGYLTLHPAAVELYGAETASEAVLVALEASARMIDTPGLSQRERRGEMVRKVARLAAGRLIFYYREPPFQQGSATISEQPTPEEVAAHHGEDLPTEFDLVVAVSAKFLYRDGDRPNARGKPVLSAGGHPSSLARVCDPVDEDRDTSDLIKERRHRTFKASAAARAAYRIGEERSSGP